MKAFLGTEPRFDAGARVVSALHRVNPRLSAFAFGLLLAAVLPPGVGIKTSAQPEKATVGDPIRIDVHVSMPAGFQAQVKNPGVQTGDFSVLEFSVGGPPSRTTRLVVAVYKTGDFTFPSLPVTIRAPDGNETSASTPPVKIHIQSVLTGKESAIKDLKKQAEISESVRWLLWGTVLLGAVLLAALAWWLWRRRRTGADRKPGPSALDPLMAAEAELRALLKKGLLERGLVKQHYVALSDVVKRILEAGYGIQTLEKTTSEIIGELPGSADKELIERFLLGCDLVKFAKYTPSEEENHDATTKAFSILEICKKPQLPLSQANPAEGVA